MINIDNKLLEALKSSSCFGIAHDLSMAECKQCDVQAQCKLKTEGAIVAPPVKTVKKTTPDSTEKSTNKTTPVKNTPKTNTTKPANTPKPVTPAKQPANVGDLPDFKPMLLPELKELAATRNVVWKDYGSDQITRMRLIMGLKDSYK